MCTGYQGKSIGSNPVSIVELRPQFSHLYKGSLRTHCKRVVVRINFLYIRPETHSQPSSKFQLWCEVHVKIWLPGSLQQFCFSRSWTSVAWESVLKSVPLNSAQRLSWTWILERLYTISVSNL